MDLIVIVMSLTNIWEGTIVDENSEQRERCTVHLSNCTYSNTINLDIYIYKNIYIRREIILRSRNNGIYILCILFFFAIKMKRWKRIGLRKVVYSIVIARASFQRTSLPAVSKTEPRANRMNFCTLLSR